MNALADADPETLRISIDTKATINVGEYSRGGRSRGLEAVQALDHDMCPKEEVSAWRYSGAGYWQIVFVFRHQLQDQRFHCRRALSLVGGEKRRILRSETIGH